MDLLQLTSLLIVFAALFGAINYLFLKLPSAIGILVVSLLASLVILGLDLLVQGFTVDDQVRSLVGGIAFSDALLEGMLGLVGKNIIDKKIGHHIKSGSRPNRFASRATVKPCTMIEKITTI